MHLKIDQQIHDLLFNLITIHTVFIACFKDLLLTLHYVGRAKDNKNIIKSDYNFLLAVFFWCCLSF